MNHSFRFLVPSLVLFASLFNVAEAQYIQFGGSAAGLALYDFERFADLGGRPGSALTLLRDEEWGVAFGEKLAGQTNTAVGDFDVVRGRATVPLAIDASVPPKEGINLTTMGSTILVGLGHIGFPDYDALGEGAVTVLFDLDQVAIGFDVLGANPGPLHLVFFDREGKVIGEHTIYDPPNDTFIFSTTGPGIAAVVLNNQDTGGLGFDNFLFVPTGGTGEPSCIVDDVYVAEPEAGVATVSLSAAVVPEPGSELWTYSWITDCPGGTFDDPTSLTPTLSVDATDGCRIECSATVIVNKGYGRDVCSATVLVEGDGGGTVTCPPPTVVEADGQGNLEAFEAWLQAAWSDAGGLFNDFDQIAFGCSMTGSTTVTWEIPDAGGGCGGVSNCSSTFTIEDTTPPTLEVDTTPITVEDLDCDGEESVTLPDAWVGDSASIDVTLHVDAPDAFPAGETTTVTYTATDECGNTTTETIDVTVLHGAGVSVVVNERRVGSGAAVTPVSGAAVYAYPTGTGTCASEVTHAQPGPPFAAYPQIVQECEPAATAATDDAGQGALSLPTDHYLLIAAVDTDGDGMADRYVGRPVGNVPCGETKVVQLELLAVGENGQSGPANAAPGGSEPGRKR